MESRADVSFSFLNGCLLLPFPGHDGLMLGVTCRRIFVYLVY